MFGGTKTFYSKLSPIPHKQTVIIRHDKPNPRCKNSGVEILQAASDKTQSSTIAVDVHTDLNTELVLEEALAKFNILIIVCTNADGKFYTVAGPVYNCFEFTRPIRQRLTDEQWRNIFETTPPEPPKWTKKFAR
jgi:hypothetical protein